MSADLRPGPPPCGNERTFGTDWVSQVMHCERPAGHEGDHDRHGHGPGWVSHHRWWDEAERD